MFLLGILFPTQSSSPLFGRLIATYLISILTLFPSVVILNQTHVDPTLYKRILWLILIKVLPSSNLLGMLSTALANDASSDSSRVIGGIFLCSCEIFTGFLLSHYYIDRELVFFLRLGFRNRPRRPTPSFPHAS